MMVAGLSGTPICNCEDYLRAKACPVHPCPSCAALRAEVEQYKAAAEDDLVMRGQLRQQLYDAVASLTDIRKLRYEGKARPILYTDTVQDKQVCVDNLWAVSTEELNSLRARLSLAESAMTVVYEDHLIDGGPPCDCAVCKVMGEGR